MLEPARVHDSSCLGVHVIRSINLRIRCGKSRVVTTNVHEGMLPRQSRNRNGKT
uniref:Uncharacterized protein n=1 Tax=Anguilla anguilla TaxID=7936 RepID=A0A0E9VW75_ANGAN